MNSPDVSLAEPRAAVLLPAAPKHDPLVVVGEGGFIDTRATTNNWAKAVSEILGEPINVKEPTFCSGVVLFAGQATGFYFGKISHFTGLPRSFCAHVIRNLGFNKLLAGKYLGGDLISEADKPESEADAFGLQILFVMYCLAASGQVLHDKGRWRSVPDNDRSFYEIREVA